MYQQLCNDFGSILSPRQCGFHKGPSAQHCLIVMLEKFKESRVREGNDLSNAFACINHNLLITKITYSNFFLFKKPDAKCYNKYNSYSNESEIMYGVPQV